MPLVAVINAGAGIPATYYKRFAEGLADRGIVTITCDYRGIGPLRVLCRRSSAGVAYDWAARTRPDFKRNFRRMDSSVDYEGLATTRSRFEAVDADVLAITIADDLFATSAASVRLRGLFSGVGLKD